MKKVNYVLLTTIVLMATAILLWGCGQKEGSNPESLFVAKHGGHEGGDQDRDYDCSITVPDPEPEDLSSLALITAAQAEEAALAAYPGTTVIELELDNEDGCLVFSVELSNDLELKIDAGNGEILYMESADEDDDEDYEDEGEGDVDEDEEQPSYECSITVPDPEPQDLAPLAQITADQAREAALAAYPGTTVIEVELDNENGCLVYSIELSNGLEVKIDAGNGEILHVESDDDSGGDD